MTMTESEVQENEDRQFDDFHELDGRSLGLRGGRRLTPRARIEEPQPRGKTNPKGKTLQHDFALIFTKHVLALAWPTCEYHNALIEYRNNQAP